MTTQPDWWGKGNLDVVQVNWHTTLVAKILLESVSKEWAKLYSDTHIAFKDFFMLTESHGKFQVGETACEFTPENDRCNIRLGEKA